ncbi:MAG TPA: hypothetical protein VGB37_11665 [Candidatus Lokiarchaeia archaeon]
MIFFVTVPNLNKVKEIALELCKNKLANWVNIVNPGKIYESSWEERGEN